MILRLRPPPNTWCSSNRSFPVIPPQRTSLSTRFLLHGSGRPYLSVVFPRANPVFPPPPPPSPPPLPTLPPTPPSCPPPPTSPPPSPSPPLSPSLPPSLPPPPSLRLRSSPPPVFAPVSAYFPVLTSATAKGSGSGQPNPRHSPTLRRIYIYTSCTSCTIGSRCIVPPALRRNDTPCGITPSSVPVSTTPRHHVGAQPGPSLRCVYIYRAPGCTTRFRPIDTQVLRRNDNPCGISPWLHPLHTVGFRTVAT